MDLGDYISEQKTYFIEMKTMLLAVNEEKQATILLVSEVSEESLKCKMAALKTVDGAKAM